MFRANGTCSFFCKKCKENFTILQKHENRKGFFTVSMGDKK